MHRLLLTHAARTALLLAAGALGLSVRATTYYVSATGSDANSGTTQAQAWRTIARVNQLSFSLQPGDQVLFQKGGTYRGRLEIGSSGTTASPITIGAYGSGAAPIISGGQVVTGWTQHSGNIWKVQVPGSVKYLFSGGQLMTIARYPNTGWLRNDQGTSTRINDDALTQASGYWTGSEVVIRGSNWSYDISTVTSSIPGQINFTDMYMSLDTMHHGYFLRNKLSELDMAGEWFHDASSGWLYFWAPGSVDPNTLSLEACNTDHGAWVYLNRHDVVIDGIKFMYQTGRSVFVDAAHHVTVRNCTFEDVAMAIFSYGHDDIYQANTFNRTYHTAISMVDENSVVETSTFTNIAMQPGLGETNWGYMGIRAQGTNCIVRDNRLTTIGYIGISAYGNTTVERNYVKSALALLNDGCGIGMENADGVIIRDNIILDISGNYESMAPNSPLYWNQGMGIYFGNVSVKNTLVQNNTIANCKGAGIHVDHTMVTTGVQIKDNVLFNNNIQLSVSDFSNYNGPGATPPYHVPSYNTIYSGNVLYSLTREQLCMKQMHCYSMNWVDFGNFSNNFYFNPYNEVSIQQFNMVGAGIRNFCLEKWQNVTGEDAGSSRSPLRLERYAVTNEYTSNLLANGAFTNNINGWQGWPTQGLMTHDFSKLDNGAMRVDFSNNSSYNTFYLTNTAQNQVQTGQWYRMRFSLVSNMLGTLQAGFKTQTQLTGPQMVTSRDIPFSSERREVTLLFQSNITDQGFCQFMNNYQESTYWIDNIELHRVAVMEQDPLDRQMHLYNDLSTTASVPLTGCWSDVQGQYHSGSIDIPPYSSVVLIKEDDILCGLSTGVEEGVATATSAAQVYPNPVQHGGELFFHAAIKGDATAELIDTQGRVMQTAALRNGQRSLSLNPSLAPGAYILRTLNGEGPSARVIIQ